MSLLNRTTDKYFWRKKKVNHTLKYSKIFSTSRQNEIKADVLTLKWLLNEIYFCVITLGGN